jgi:hypothetical protein
MEIPNQPFLARTSQRAGTQQRQSFLGLSMQFKNPKANCKNKDQRKTPIPSLVL